MIEAIPAIPARPAPHGPPPLPRAFGAKEVCGNCVYPADNCYKQRASGFPWSHQCACRCHWPTIPATPEQAEEVARKQVAAARDPDDPPNQNVPVAWNRCGEHFRVKHLAALLALLDEERGRNVAFKKITVEDGKIDASLAGDGVKVMVAGLAEWFQAVGGINYVEMRCWTQKAGHLVLTLQKCPGKTPHELRTAAEDALKAIIRIVDEERLKPQPDAATAMLKCRNKASEVLHGQSAPASGDGVRDAAGPDPGVR